jgi:hypothetical protein
MPDPNRHENIRIGGGEVVVDAALLGEVLSIDPAELPALLRSGAVTSLCERGIGEDEGRHRLTFFHRNRRIRFTVDASGRILQRSTIDFGEMPLPRQLHRAGA